MPRRSSCMSRRPRCRGASAILTGPPRPGRMPSTRASFRSWRLPRSATKKRRVVPTGECRAVHTGRLEFAWRVGCRASPAGRRVVLAEEATAGTACKTALKTSSRPSQHSRVVKQLGSPARAGVRCPSSTYTRGLVPSGFLAGGPAWRRGQDARRRCEVPGTWAVDGAAGAGKESLLG